MAASVCAIPSATAMQVLATAGRDSEIVDWKQKAVDIASAHAMIAATLAFHYGRLVRVTQNDPAQVKRALDIGAECICFPPIRSAEDAQQAVASLRYPPYGRRGAGPCVAQSRFGGPG